MRKIKQVLLNIISWIKSFIYLFYWFIVHCFKSDFKNHVKRGEVRGSIDIIVNGPSFAKQIEHVKNDGFEKCMVNFAANTPQFWELKPNYYCVSDPVFFRSDTESDMLNSFMENIKKIDWNMVFFVPYVDYKHHIKGSDLDNLPYVKFIPFNSTPFPYSFKFKRLAYWLFRKGQAMPIPMSVSVPVIMNILNSGYSQIYLYGYDHNWIHNVVVDENNQVCLQDTHFDNEKGTLRPWKKNATETFKMHEVLETQVELFESYWFIKDYIDTRSDVKIVNKSSNSLLDAFDRK